VTALAKAKQLHGVLMLLGWGVLLPVGVLMARYLKWKGPLWLKLHIGLQASRRARAYIDRPNPRADRVLRRRPSVVQTEALAYPFHPRPRPRRLLAPPACLPHPPQPPYITYRTAPTPAHPAPPTPNPPAPPAPPQISGLAFGLAGLILALVQFGPLGGSFGGHGLMGLLVSALGLLQPLKLQRLKGRVRDRMRPSESPPPSPQP
jgi:hypothetical protein